MNLKSLRTFLEIVETGSYRAAAERLDITQSTASARVRELERHLGRTLFDRVGRNVVPSDHGRSLIDAARRIAAAVDQAEIDVAHGSALARKVRVGVVEVIAISWLPALAGAVAATWPRVRLALMVQSTERLVALLGAREIDVALVPSSGDRDGFERVGLGRTRWCLKAAPTLGLHGRRLRPADLADVPLLTLGSGSLIDAALRDWFAASGVTPARLTTCDSLSAVLAMARAGAGASLLPHSLGAPFADGLVALEHTALEDDFEYVALCDRDCPGALVRKIVGLARETSGFSGAAVQVSADVPPN